MVMAEEASARPTMCAIDIHRSPETTAKIAAIRKARAGQNTVPQYLGDTMRDTAATLDTSTWSTPRASDGEKGGPNQAFSAGGQPLPAQMHQASPRVTPSARDWKDSPGMATETGDRNRIDQLPRQMSQAPQSAWPRATPQSRDGKGSRSPNGSRELRPGGQMLNEQIVETGDLAPSPRATITLDGNYNRKGASATSGDGIATQMLGATEPIGPTPNGSSATTVKRGAPNPVFAFWLMGFPDEWISGALEAMRSYRKPRRK